MQIKSAHLPEGHAIITQVHHFTVAYSLNALKVF